ncbi:MAG: ABC transporter permease [Gammaproteobacteria bacterium]|nr:ABC transporter permease [Gammaproteobacteria bacterium]
MDSAIKDLIQGLLSFRIWSMLAWQEIRQRYRRSTLGPLWLTLSTGIMILAMGPLYGGLFGQTLDSYFLYLATGIVSWQLISTTIQDSCLAFIGSEGFIKQLKLPLSLYVLRIIWKNLIIYLHTLVIVVIIYIFFPPPIPFQMLFFVFGIFLFSVNAIWVGIVVGLLCARFRDITPIVTSIVGVMFFITPIMWPVKMLGGRLLITELNPFYHFMEIIRGPIIGDQIQPISWIMVILITLFGYLFMLLLYSRFRARIAYWI